jgi:dUTP pyrophosphatase
MTVKVINRSSNPLPEYATSFAAGLDVRADNEAPIVLQPLGRAMVPTGLFLEIPAGYEVQVRPRSGLAAKKGITVLNAPGTIDEGYRGEVRVILINHGLEVFRVEPGMRIAQLVVAPVLRGDTALVDSRDDTTRGTGGFGSTGT